MKKLFSQKWFLIITTCVFVWTLAIVAATALNTGVSGTLKWLSGENTSFEFDTTSLTNEATSAVTTKLVQVKTCMATVTTLSAGTAAHQIICTVPTQTGTNRGKIILNANNIGDTASGTTVATYGVTGYGMK
jgi:hypothetical protein